MCTGSERFVHVQKGVVVDPDQVDGLSFRRGEVTIHLRSGRAMYVTTKYGADEYREDGAEWAIAEVMAILWPSPEDSAPPVPD